MKHWWPLMLLLAGCGGGPEGARLTVAVVGDPERPASLAKRLVAEATQPTLVARDGAGQTVAGLATSWRFVDDDKGLILRLRPVKWVGGDKAGKSLVSRDVVAAFRRAAGTRDPVMASAGLQGGAAIVGGKAQPATLGVMAPISRVVELRLETASPLLLGWLAEPALGVTSAKGNATLAAYRVAGPPERRVLTRIGAESRADARPAVVTVLGSPDAKAAIAGFLQGRNDIVMGEGLAGLGEARSSARPDVLRVDPLWGVYGYLANGVRGPTANAGVRRALAMAVDRDALAASFGLAAIAPAEGLLPPSLGGGNGAVWAGVDEQVRLAEARRLLAEAGWTAERPLRLVLLLPPGRDHIGVAERVAADWARIGVFMAITEVDAATHDRIVKRGDYDLAVSEASVPVPDAAALLARYRCGAGPHCNPEADALLAEARAVPPDDRPLLLGRAEAALMAGPPMIPLFTPVRWALVARNVEGWVPNRAASHPVARLAVTGKRR